MGESRIGIWQSALRWKASSLRSLPLPREGKEKKSKRLGGGIAAVSGGEFRSQKESAHEGGTS